MTSVLRATAGIAAGIVLAGAASANVIPGWMSATGNGTIDYPNPMTAGFHRAESGIGTISGAATFTQNSGSFGNWIMRDDGNYDSVPGGEPLDSTYSVSRTVDFSMPDANTLRILSTGGYALTGADPGGGDDIATEERLLRITAQEDIQIMIEVNAIITGGASSGWGGTTTLNSAGGFYENLSQVSPTVEGTYNLTAGGLYDIFSFHEFLMHENTIPGVTGGFSFETEILITVVPAPGAAATFLGFGALAMRRRR